MQRRHIVWLVVGVTAVSTSAILIRAAGDLDVPSLAIAFYRCFLAGVILVPIAVLRHPRELRGLTGSHRRLIVASGVALGLHFATWISSLSYTSIAASAVLVQTMPIWVALAGPITGERTSRRGWIGVLVALSGAVVIASASDATGGADPVLGDVLALTGALFAAVYVMIGRRVRPHLSLVSYTASVYAIAALLLAAAMLATGTAFFGYPSEAWLLFAAMTAGPQFLGHTVFNFLLGELRASVVSVALLAEPIGATLLAFVVFGEQPGLQVVVGGAIVLAGVAVTVMAEAGRRPDVLAMPDE
jgi:drug/metabolite transporter (DMT)-like permease